MSTDGLPPYVRNGSIGVLPPGRWTVSRAEFIQAFAPRGTSRMREAILKDFDTFARLQRQSGLVVSSYWVNGSFVTTKANPNDIDVVAIVDASQTGSPDSRAHALLNPGGRWKREPHPEVGRVMLVHAFGVVVPRLGASKAAWAEYSSNLESWDEWFSHFEERQNGKGYVEVRW